MLFNLPNLNIVCDHLWNCVRSVCCQDPSLPSLREEVSVKKQSTFVCFKGRNGETTTKYWEFESWSRGTWGGTGNSKSLSSYFQFAFWNVCSSLSDFWDSLVSIKVSAGISKMLCKATVQADNPRNTGVWKQQQHCYFHRIHRALLIDAFMPSTSLFVVQEQSLWVLC